nr:hypothetical protein [Tanacetum cinerariifolium]
IQNRQRNLGDPSLLLDFEEINMNPNNVQGSPPVGPNLQNHGPLGLNLQNLTPNLRPMEQLLQAPTDASSVSDSSSQNDAITTLSRQVEALSKQISSMNKPVHAIQEGCETCGGPHPYFECQAASGYTQDVYATTGNYNARGILTKALQERPQGVLPSNTVPNPREDIKVITTRSGIALAGPSVPLPPLFSSSKELATQTVAYPAGIAEDVFVHVGIKSLHEVTAVKVCVIAAKLNLVLLSLESVEARLLVYKKNESVYEEDIKLLKRLGYNDVPPPYTRNFLPLKLDLSGLEEFVNEPIVSEPTVKKPAVETSEAKASADKPKVLKVNAARHNLILLMMVNAVEVYTSCIEQFWATVKAKTVNEEGQLQALVDGKKVIITESTIRRDLQLEDAEGVVCLPNVGIFEQLTLMGFVQVFLDKQLERMSNHNRIYVLPSHTKKIFGNIKRIGKGFSGRETPLFPTMMIQAQEEMGEGSANPTDSHHTPTIIQPSTSQPQKTKQHRKHRRKVTEERVNIFKTQSKATPNEPGSQRTSSGGGPRCQEAIGDNVAQTRVLDLETIKTIQALEIDSLKMRVKRLERRKRSRTHGLKRLYKVGLSVRVKSSKDDGVGEEDASIQGRRADIDANDDIYLVNVHNDEDMFGGNDSDGDEVIVEDAKMLFDVADDLRVEESARPNVDKVVIQESEQGTTITTTAATTITATSTRPKAKGLVIHEQEQAPTPTVSSQRPSQVKDKGKRKMIEPEPVKKLSKRDQLMLDEELTFKP